jgi:protein-L-isoaspartate(D-aspartate) O-methyltransferase
MPAGDLSPAERRAAMVRHDLARRGMRDGRVLAAMGEVPREEFVPAGAAAHAYEDRALPIGDRQTVSQPYVVAEMLESLSLGPADRLLEVGAGSGYAAAVASRLCARVVAVERLHRLAAEAAERVARLGYANVTVVEGDGTLGWVKEAPYDAILVSAGAPAVPPALVGQLAEGGRLVVPVGGGGQRLIRVRRAGPALEEDDLGPVAFVPLIGAQGWPSGLGDLPGER